MNFIHDCNGKESVQQFDLKMTQANTDMFLPALLTPPHLLPSVYPFHPSTSPFIHPSIQACSHCTEQLAQADKHNPVCSLQTSICPVLSGVAVFDEFYFNLSVSVFTVYHILYLSLHASVNNMVE